MAYSYARLVALAFGFQHAFGKGHTDENPFLKRVRYQPLSPELCQRSHLFFQCIRAASDVVTAMVDDIGRPSQSESELMDLLFSLLNPCTGIYVRHGPESQTVFVAFSCAFLIKVRPFAPLFPLHALTEKSATSTEICIIYIIRAARGNCPDCRTRHRVSRLS